MHKEIIVNSTSNEVRIGLMEDHELVEISVERAEVKRVVGNVYKGVITAVRPGLQAAFVDIGMEKAGFLHVSDLVHAESDDDDDRGGRRRGRGRQRDAMRPIETMIREGEEILVQVTKEVIGTKGPRLTADLSLPGRFLVMMPRGDHVGVSRKIDDRRERARLREMLDKLKPGVGAGAYIIRTAGLGIDQKMLQQDMDYLHGLWTTIEEKAGVSRAPALVHEDVGLIVGLVRDIFKEDIDALHIDDREDYEKLIRYVKTFAPELRNRVHHYTGDVPIFDKFGIEAEIKKSLDKKVWLKRGGFLVIEQTEAMVTIDVNTGRFTGKKNQEETIFRTNMMAAKEIPRQLRLRDIGGIIVIDFIDMENEADRRRVLNEVRSHLRHDRSRTKTFGVSELGLVEMSRQRVRESLKDQLSDDCPFCRGTGQVLSLETLANKVELLLGKVWLRTRERAVQIQANPTLALALMGERSEAIQRIAGDQDLKVSVIEDVRLHREDFRILSLQNRRDLVPELEDSRQREGGPSARARTQDRGRDSGRSDRARTDRGRGDRDRSDRSRGDRDRSDRSRSDRGRSDRGRSDRALSDRSRSDRGPSDRSRSDRGPSDRSRSDRGPSDRGRGDQGRAEQARGERGGRGRPRRAPRSDERPAADTRPAARAETEAASARGPSERRSRDSQGRGRRGRGRGTQGDPRERSAAESRVEQDTTPRSGAEDTRAERSTPESPMRSHEDRAPERGNESFAPDLTRSEAPAPETATADTEREGMRAPRRRRRRLTRRRSAGTAAAADGASSSATEAAADPPARASGDDRPSKPADPGSDRPTRDGQARMEGSAGRERTPMDRPQEARSSERGSRSPERESRPPEGRDRAPVTAAPSESAGASEQADSASRREGSEEATSPRRRRRRRRRPSRGRASGDSTSSGSSVAVSDGDSD